MDETDAYEVRTDDEADHLLSTAATFDDAMDTIDDLADITADQLRANGEGAREFEFRVLVRHHHQTVAWSTTLIDIA